MASAGIVSRIRVENFMCHTSLCIDLGDSVNFITGQNGSGKSAILTALCVAFGCRAKGTQRATTLKDFIKTGCSYAVVSVEIKNKGEDAYNHHIYGDLIIVERRITDSTTSTILKDHLGKKVSQKMAELRELIEHFNIDVENPCVIMSQDKSREFLHSGNDKDKFKFFFKATLLQQVSELLQSIKGHLESAETMVSDLQLSIQPIQKQLIELQEKIKNMKHIEEITQQAQVLKKKLAWSWVYDVDKQIEDQKVKLGTLRDRIPTCQDRIDKRAAKLEESRRQFLSKKAEIASLMESTLEVRKKKDELQQELSMATKKKYEFQAELSRNTSVLQKLGNQVSRLMLQIDDIQESHIKLTQAEESELQEQLKDIQSEIDATLARVTRLKDEEKASSDSLSLAADATRVVAREIEENERKRQRISSQIQDLKRRQTNKVTTFGGDRVLRLLQVIERRHRGFRNPPIGPIGVHVRLVDETWAFAVETSIGKLLESFVVTDSKDAHLLRSCAREANYNNLKIFIYDFSRPRLNIPRDMLPSTSHPTIFSVLQSDSDVVMNVLVDMAGIERQVLVRDYEMGKRVAFEQRVRNLKDVYTSDGFRMFCRGCVETTLPPNNRIRVGRLCGSIEEYIYKYEKETESMDEHIQQCKKRKRSAEEECRKLEGEVQTIKRQRMKEESFLMSKQDKLQSMKIAHETETNIDNAPDVNELHQEISKLREEMKEHENSFDEIKASLTMSEQKATDLKISFEKLCESAKGEIFDAIAESERELIAIEQSIRIAEEEKAHYEAVMRTKVLSAIKEAEDLYQKLQHGREESCKKASIICSESEVESLGGCAENTPEQLSAQLNRLQHRLQHESHRCTEPVEDLQILYEKKERKIMVKQQTYQAFGEKLNTLLEALDLRSNKFQRNASLLKRQLTWQFNGHLGRKGFSGHVDVNYPQKTLSVTMAPDSSDDIVHDTRGLSGGERSFSTLCFALALHEMTEAPFRAMDEFDVFMDAVSRKISLETVVDFAVQQGSQWIFITPHDISMVNAGEKVKKQQMAPPRA